MLTLTYQPDPTPPFERCCFCRRPTPFWFQPKDVACCRECGGRAEPSDVPSKKEWMRRERLASPSSTEPSPLALVEGWPVP